MHRQYTLDSPIYIYIYIFVFFLQKLEFVRAYIKVTRAFVAKFTTDLFINNVFKTFEQFIFNNSLHTL